MDVKLCQAKSYMNKKKLNSQIIKNFILYDFEYLDKVEEDAVTVIPESLEIQETPEEIVNEQDVSNEDNVNNKVTTEKEAGIRDC